MGRSLHWGLSVVLAASYLVAGRAEEVVRDLRELTETANCPNPIDFTTPLGVSVACCYNSTLTGLPCCDSQGNPCRILEDHPDCCIAGNSGPGSKNCEEIFHAEGVDSGSYMVTLQDGTTEKKVCLWDGGSANGHGRCYAASAEASLWQASFPQLLQVSTAFGFAAPAPLVREAGLLPPTCYDKIVVTPLEPEGIVIDCASVAIKDGSLCVSNQLKGTCQSSVCVTVPTVTITTPPAEITLDPETPSPLVISVPTSPPAEQPCDCQDDDCDCQEDDCDCQDDDCDCQKDDCDCQDDDCDCAELDGVDVEELHKKYPESDITAVKIRIGCDDDDEADCEEHSVKLPDGLVIPDLNLSSSDVTHISSDISPCDSDSDDDCEEGEDIEAVVQHVIDAALEKYPGQIDTITKVSVEIGCDDDEDCDDSDDSCDCLADDCDCPEEECDDDDDKCNKAPTCPEARDPICPLQQQGEATCLTCTSCYAKTAAPGTVSVSSYLKQTIDGQDMASLTLKVLDDTSSGQHCLVRDVTLRLLKGRHWSQNELVASDNGPEPIYDSCCDAAETGLSNTLYWELDTNTFGSKDISISWYGDEEGKDIFASPSKLNFTASTALPAITDDILYVLGTTCGCTYGTIPKKDLDKSQPPASPPPSPAFSLITIPSPTPMPSPMPMPSPTTMPSPPTTASPSPHGTYGSPPTPAYGSPPSSPMPSPPVSPPPSPSSSPSTSPSASPPASPSPSPSTSPSTSPSSPPSQLTSPSPPPSPIATSTTGVQSTQCYPFAVSSAGCDGPITVTITASGAVASALTLPTAPITLTAASQKVSISVDSTSMTAAGSYCGIISFSFVSTSTSVAAQACINNLVTSMVQQIADFSLTGIQATQSVVLSKNKANPLQIDAKLCIDVFPGSSWELPCLQSTMSALLSLKTAMGSGNAWAWSPSTSYCDWFGISCTSDDQLQSLDLSNAGLSGQMPDGSSLLAMSKLQSLDLSGNDLTGSIPNNLGLMKDLYDLDLSGNSFEGCLPADLQFLSAAASVSLSGNSGLCGGVPFGVSQQVQLLIDGTSLQYPCFSKDIDLVMSDQDSCPLSFSDQGYYVCGPGPVMLEYFNLERIYYELTVEPLKGWIYHVGAPDVALKAGDKMAMLDLMAGVYIYTRAIGQTGFDGFTCDVLEQPEVSVTTFSSLIASPMSYNRALLEVNSSASQDVLLSSGILFSVRDTAAAWGFAAETTAIRQQADGSGQTVALSDLAVNDTVLVVADDGTTAWDTVYLLAVVDTFQPHTYSQITTEGGAQLQLSKAHYLPVSAVQGTQLSTAVYKQACDVEVGEFLWTVNEWATQNTYAVPVTENINVTAYGDVMPLTMTGRMIVNSLLASTSVNADTNNAAFAQAVEPLIGAYNLAVSSGKLASYEDIAQGTLSSILSSSNTSIAAATATLMDVQFQVASS